MEPIHIFYKKFHQDSCGGHLGARHKVCLFENRLGMTQITVFPKLSSSSTMKSVDISFHGKEGLVTGCSIPGVLPGHLFAVAHTRQLATYCSMPIFMFGHQNCCFMRWRVFYKPKMPHSLCVSTVRPKSADWRVHKAWFPSMLNRLSISSLL